MMEIEKTVRVAMHKSPGVGGGTKVKDKKKKGPPAIADNPLTLTLTLCKYKITS